MAKCKALTGSAVKEFILAESKLVQLWTKAGWEQFRYIFVLALVTYTMHI